MTSAIAPEEIGIIVLAAGAARRFGADKRRARFDKNQTLLAATLATIPATFTRRVLVLKAGDDDLAQQFGSGWHICVAENPEAGMANSLASGIALASGWKGAVIALGDMPYIKPATYTLLQAALTGHDIVVPMYRGKRGNPVGFRHDYFDAIAALHGDRGARSLLTTYAQACYGIETEDEGVLRDVDTPESLT